MQRVTSLIGSVVGAGAVAGAAATLAKPLASGRLARPFHETTGVNALDGKPFDFGSTRGRVVLVTNVACGCGYTRSDYDQLRQLHHDFAGKLEILAFPSNEFGKQEPGTPAEIRDFVAELGVAFPMMEKSNVNGPDANPVWLELKRATGTEDVAVRWNFETKFLIAKDGVSVQRFAKAFGPEKLRGNIEELVNAPDAA